MTEPQPQSVVKVYGESYEPKKFDKVLFAGNADDARDFVVNNYPRHHGHVDAPEVYVEHADGKPEHYYGGKWTNLGESEQQTETSTDEEPEL